MTIVPVRGGFETMKCGIALRRTSNACITTTEYAVDGV